MPTLVAAKNCLDWHCSIPIQLGVAGFIADGHLTRHVGRMRKVYAQRRAALYEGIHAKLSRWAAPIPSYYGMHVAVWLKEGIDLTAALRDVAEKGVRLHSLDRYYLRGEGAAGLVFGYGTADLGHIQRGIDLLASALDTHS